MTSSPAAPNENPAALAANWLAHHGATLAALTDASALQQVLGRPLRDLLGHTAALALIGRISCNRFVALLAVNAGYPQALVQQAQQGGDVSTRPLLAMWLQHRKPLFVDAALARAAASELERREITQYALGCMAIHGSVELSGATGTYFSFSGLPPDDGAAVTTKLSLVTPHLHAALLAVWRAECAAWRQRITPTERDLLQALAEGLSNPQIAHLRGRSPATVRNQLHHLMAKLGAESRLELLQRAAELGLLHTRHGSSVP